MKDRWRVEHRLDYMGLPWEWRTTEGRGGTMTFEEAMEYSLAYRQRCLDCTVGIDLTMRMVNVETGECVPVNVLEMIVV